MSELTPSCGSSETTRKAPSFSTEDFYAHARRRMFRAYRKLLQWFVGF
jgi:rRNA maturation protein Nop10